MDDFGSLFGRIFGADALELLRGCKREEQPKRKFAITVRDGMIDGAELAAAFDEIASMADQSRGVSADEARIVSRTYRVAAKRIRNLLG